MKALILFIAVLSVSVSAVLVSIDPDEFDAGTDISNAWAGITLSSGGGASNLDGKVYAAYRSGSSGNKVFANSRVSNKLWLNSGNSGSYYLQVDFHIPTNHVLIDVISDGGSDFPGLSFSTNGVDYTWVQNFPVLGPGQSYTASVPLRDIADIVSIRVGGYGTVAQYGVLLDNLRYEQIPEPATGLMLLSGLLLLKIRKK